MTKIRLFWDVVHSVFEWNCFGTLILFLSFTYVFLIFRGCQYEFYKTLYYGKNNMLVSLWNSAQLFFQVYLLILTFNFQVICLRKISPVPCAKPLCCLRLIITFWAPCVPSKLLAVAEHTQVLIRTVALKLWCVLLFFSIS